MKTTKDLIELLEVSPVIFSLYEIGEREEADKKVTGHDLVAVGFGSIPSDNGRLPAMFYRDPITPISRKGTSAITTSDLLLTLQGEDYLPNNKKRLFGGHLYALHAIGE